MQEGVRHEMSKYVPLSFKADMLPTELLTILYHYTDVGNDSQERDKSRAKLKKLFVWHCLPRVSLGRLELFFFVFKRIT